MAGGLEEIVYDHARGALEQQRDDVKELRARASTLIAGASLANSVFAALALDGTGGLGGAEIAALIALGGVLICGLFVLMPHRLVFVLDPERLYENLWPDRDDTATVHRRLTDVLWRARRSNFGRVQLLHMIFAFGVVLLAASLGLWGVALAV